MTDSEIIAKQARQIIELEAELVEISQCHQRAVMHILCIGGPLNYNKLKFTPEQQKVFQSILNELE